MKKTYFSPVTEVTFVQATQMLAASLPIGKGTVDGGNALSKGNGWDVFGEDDEDDAEE